ncbi:Ribonuclease BN, tRNA processing enzyme [Cyclonatronum proteinivorum]|uniref:Ribonuclease BN, tRNA processing enzyme n=1 Tax=Cyclonatronum proteinivorum TaxID=1457365 RepID=A0A345UMV3_9BACT|nr:MBL fold metallo-hydrolase [Cyclonatronum proteinivorum]AXJ01805.1 Ribonuclease BN, tRNA processing enzyme [Cyclonatronum proteinivorum]
MTDHKNPASMRIEFLGVRGSVPTPGKHTLSYGGNTSCVLIQFSDSDHHLFLDAGTGIVKGGNRLADHPTPVGGRILLTHAHSDHIQGIPFFKPLYQPHHQFHIHMPEQAGQNCEQVLKMLMAPAFFPVNTDAFKASITYITQGTAPVKFREGYEVEALTACHPGNTFMYKVKYKNLTLVYCPDNELKPNDSAMRARVSEFINGCDMLIHDSHESRSSYENKRGWGHSAWEDVTELAFEASVKQLYLTHHAPESRDAHLEQRQQRLSMMNRRPPTALFAREGFVTELTASA